MTQTLTIITTIMRLRRFHCDTCPLHVSNYGANPRCRKCHVQKHIEALNAKVQ